MCVDDEISENDIKEGIFNRKVFPALYMNSIKWNIKDFPPKLKHRNKRYMLYYTEIKIGGNL